MTAAWPDTEPPCGTCSRCTGREPTPAVIRWWTHGGAYHNDLCASCASCWLGNAVDDPEMLPARIERIGQRPDTRETPR